MRAVRAYEALVQEARSCRLCPLVAPGTCVVGPASGRLDARVLVVAEAPGQRGAVKTGVPLTHDATGRRFSRFLEVAGVPREALFITNAVLCNPRDAVGNNRSPTAAEVLRCSRFLDSHLRIVDPEVVVALGAVALAALGALEPHGGELRRDVAKPLRWRGRWLVPLYHTSPQARLHRPDAAQEEDWRALGALLQEFCLDLSA